MDDLDDSPPNGPLRLYQSDDVDRLTMEASFPSFRSTLSLEVRFFGSLLFSSSFTRFVSFLSSGVLRRRVLALSQTCVGRSVGEQKERYREVFRFRGGGGGGGTEGARHRKFSICSTSFLFSSDQLSSAQLGQGVAKMGDYGGGMKRKFDGGGVFLFFGAFSVSLCVCLSYTFRGCCIPAMSAGQATKLLRRSYLLVWLAFAARAAKRLLERRDIALCHSQWHCSR